MVEKPGMPYLYEIFIIRAHNYDDYKYTNGAQASYFQNLIFFEDSPNVVKHLKKSHSQYLSEVKGYISLAIDKFLSKKNLKESEINTFNEMKKLLVSANDASSLFSIIEMSFDYLERTK